MVMMHYTIVLVLMALTGVAATGANTARRLFTATVTAANRVEFIAALKVDNAVIDLQADIVLQGPAPGNAAFGVLDIPQKNTVTIFSSSGRKSISGDGQFACIWVNDDAILTIDGITIERCKGTAGTSGAMWVASGASVTATNLQVSDNIATGGSTAGIWVWHSAFTCDNCFFSNNVPEAGQNSQCGALCYRGTKLELTNTVFKGNAGGKATICDGGTRAILSNVHFGVGQTWENSLQTSCPGTSTAMCDVCGTCSSCGSLINCAFEGDLGFVAAGFTAMCKLPADITAYSISQCDTGAGNTNAIEEKNCALSCAAGFHNSSGAPQVACPTHNGEFVVQKGCEINKCTLPAVTNPYEVGTCNTEPTNANPIAVANCTLTCAVGYHNHANGAPNVSCAAHGGQFAISNPCQPNKCSLPANTVGYVKSLCGAAGGTTVAVAACALSCDVAAGYKDSPNGAPQVSCPTEGGLFTISNACQVPNGATPTNATVATAAKFFGNIVLKITWKDDLNGHKMTRAVRQSLAIQLNVNISAVTVVGTVKVAELSVSFTVSVSTDAAEGVSTIIKLMNQRKGSTSFLTELKKQLLEVGFPQVDLGTVQISTLTAKRDCASDTTCEKENQNSAMVNGAVTLDSSKLAFVLVALLVRGWQVE